MQAGPDDTENRRRRYEHAAEKIMLAGALGLAAEALLPGAGTPGWVLPASEIISGWGSGFVAWNGTGRKLMPLYLATLGTFIGSWSAAAAALGLWTGTSIATWFAGMTVLVPLGIAASCHREDRQEEPDIPAIEMAPPEEDPDQGTLDQFEYMFSELDAEDVTALSVETTSGGRVLQLMLPNTGKVTVDTLNSLAQRIEVILKMQPGTVSFETATNSAHVLMRLREKNSLLASRELTPDLYASTINHPFPIGFQENGSPLLLLLREIHAMFIGSTGGGKSNLLNVVIAQLARCVDTVIWMIDMKGGRAARPWFQAWENGEAGAPVIDWVATTREEAWLMMQAVLAAIDIRMNSGVGADKIIPTASLPQIVVVNDEMKVLFGSDVGTRKDVGENGITNSQFIAKGELLTQTGRSEAVASLWATQRGTNSMAASGDLKANCNLVLALKPSNAGELQYAIPNAPHFAQKQLAALATTPGVALMAEGSHISGISKILKHGHVEGECGSNPDNPRCVPECKIYRTALETGNIRPELDAMTAGALGPVYADRWRRASEQQIVRVPSDVLNGTRRSVALADPGLSDFDEIVSGLSDPDSQVNPARVRMREFLALQGVVGASPKAIMEDLINCGYAVARETVQRWLADDRDDGIVHNPDYRRWKFGEGPNWKDDNDPDC